MTQQFNTTTSMGRLTLNVLLSFAQFEREVDRRAHPGQDRGLKTKGMWMGGNVPLGYDVKDRKLVVNEASLAKVDTYSKRYLALGCDVACRSQPTRGQQQRTLTSDRVLGGRLVWAWRSLSSAEKAGSIGARVVHKEPPIGREPRRYPARNALGTTYRLNSPRTRSNAADNSDSEWSPPRRGSSFDDFGATVCLRSYTVAQR